MEANHSALQTAPEAFCDGKLGQPDYGVAPHVPCPILDGTHPSLCGTKGAQRPLDREEANLLERALRYPYAEEKNLGL